MREPSSSRHFLLRNSVLVCVEGRVRLHRPGKYMQRLVTTWPGFCCLLISSVTAWNPFDHYLIIITRSQWCTILISWYDNYNSVITRTAFKMNRSVTLFTWASVISEPLPWIKKKSAVPWLLIFHAVSLFQIIHLYCRKRSSTQRNSSEDKFSSYLNWFCVEFFFFFFLKFCFFVCFYFRRFFTWHWDGICAKSGISSGLVEKFAGSRRRHGEPTSTQHRWGLRKAASKFERPPWRCPTAPVRVPVGPTTSGPDQAAPAAEIQRLRRVTGSHEVADRIGWQSAPAKSDSSRAVPRSLKIRGCRGVFFPFVNHWHFMVKCDRC